MGTLSTVEDGVINKLVHLRLGISIDRSSEIKQDKTSVEDTAPDAQPSTSSQGILIPQSTNADHPTSAADEPEPGAVPPTNTQAELTEHFAEPGLELEQEYALA